MRKGPFPPFSFEFFPAKTPEGWKNFRTTTLSLAESEPEFFSVTFGAGGSTRDGTFEAITLLQKNTSIPVAPHLTCVGYQRDEIKEILRYYQSIGIKRIVALRGDLPPGMEKKGELQHANELVSFIREIMGNDVHIEVAAYPEFHPQAKTAIEDLDYFKAKVDAGADSAITQYFYNPDAYFYFRDACAKRGIFTPIKPGIMPIYNVEKLVQFSDMCGAEIPRWLFKRLLACQDNPEDVKKLSLEMVFNLCEKLLSEGAPGLHFYTLNQSSLCLLLLEKMGFQYSKALLEEYEV